MNRKKVLLFRVARPKKEKIHELCQQMGLELLEIDRMRYGEPLGKLAGIPAVYEKERQTGIYSGPELPMEMLVFSGLDSEELDRFLKGYRDTGLEAIPIKAVLTPFNCRWNAGQLFQELMKEHIQLRQK